MKDPCGGHCTCGTLDEHGHSSAAEVAQNGRVNTPAAMVNGVPIHRMNEALPKQELRIRASQELLRQAAIEAGLLDASDAAPEDGIQSEAAQAAIEALLGRELHIPTPDEAACLRHYEAQKSSYAMDERVLLRHILFAITPGMDIAALRRQAESTLLTLRSAPRDSKRDEFAEAARTQSNCPSGAEGGSLGWVMLEDIAPEIGRELFGKTDVGVLPRLVSSRFGLHVFEVLARNPGKIPEFSTVRSAVEAALTRQAYATAVRQYLSILAGNARIEGVDFEGAQSPLVQ